MMDRKEKDGKQEMGAERGKWYFRLSIKHSPLLTGQHQSCTIASHQWTDANYYRLKRGDVFEAMHKLDWAEIQDTISSLGLFHLHICKDYRNEW